MLRSPQQARRWPPRSCAGTDDRSPGQKLFGLRYHALKDHAGRLDAVDQADGLTNDGGGNAWIGRLRGGPVARSLEFVGLELFLAPKPFAYEVVAQNAARVARRPGAFAHDVK